MQTTSTTTAGTSLTSSSFISSDRVQGTEVFGANREHIGEIHSLVIDKVSGRIVYAMMSFGGFLGLGKSLYPIPWGKLHYDVTEGGYKTDLTEEQVRNAPEYNPDASVDPTDANRRIYDYYEIRGFWDGSDISRDDSSRRP